MENVNQRDINLVTTKARTNYLASEQSYHTTKALSDNFLPREMKRTQMFMNKPVLLSLSI